jgi:hypothetical protein
LKSRENSLKSYLFWKADILDFDTFQNHSLLIFVKNCFIFQKLFIPLLRISKVHLLWIKKINEKFLLSENSNATTIFYYCWFDLNIFLLYIWYTIRFKHKLLQRTRFFIVKFCPSWFKEFKKYHAASIICLFKAIRAIFQLSGGCHHYHILTKQKLSKSTSFPIFLLSKSFQIYYLCCQVFA